MTDQKDFLFNAKQRVELAITTERGDEKALVVATIAAAEATIALAEEQRTANLLTYLQNAAAKLEDGDNQMAVDWVAAEVYKVRVRLGLDA